MPVNGWLRAFLRRYPMLSTSLVKVQPHPFPQRVRQISGNRKQAIYYCEFFR